MSHRLSANIAAVSAFSLFGGAVAATRVVAQDLSPLTLAALRIGIGAGILWILMLLSNRGGLIVHRRDLKLLFIMAAFYFTAFPVALAVGFRVTEASRGALLLATTPIWSIILARAAGREHLSVRQTAGVVVSLAGIALVFGERVLNPLDQGSSVSTLMAVVGAALLLFAASCTAIYGVLSQRAFAAYGPLTVTSHTMLMGAAMLAPLAVVEVIFVGPGEFTALNTVLMIYLGSLGLAQLMFVFALSHLSPTQVTVYVNMNPLVATIIGAAVLGEPLTATFLAGFVTVITGVVMVNWPRRGAEPEGPRPAEQPRASPSSSADG